MKFNLGDLIMYHCHMLSDATVGVVIAIVEDPKLKNPMYKVQWCNANKVVSTYCFNELAKLS